MAHLFVAKLSNQTVKSYLAAVRHTQIALGMGNPRMEAMPRLEYVIRGAKKSTSRLTITPTILRQLKAVWEKMTCQMLWAAACVCFFGFLRAGEIIVPSDIVCTYCSAMYGSSALWSLGSRNINQGYKIKERATKSEKQSPNSLRYMVSV